MKRIRRTNHPYQCGNDAGAHPCRMGPQGSNCGRFQCVPNQTNGVWQCTRPAQLGGPCEVGPSHEGACGQKPCHPKLTMLGLRRRVTLWSVLFVLFGFLFFGTSSKVRQMLDPGPRHLVHQTIDECDACHRQDLGSIFDLFNLSPMEQDNDISMSEKCMACHNKGPNAILAHGSDYSNYTQEGDYGREHPAGFRRANAAQIACERCHREHNGVNGTLTILNDQQCQGCHQSYISAFELDHPAFGETYGLGPTSRIAFDHQNHYTKHFPEKLVEEVDCTYCHQAGQPSFMPGFNRCVECHRGDVNGEQSAGIKGFLFLSVPGVDLEALEAFRPVFGEWPEFADSDWSPFFQYLMQGSQNKGKNSLDLKSVDWFDLSTTSTSTRQLAAEALREFKIAIYEWSVSGDLFLAKALPQLGSGFQSRGGSPFPSPSPADLKELVQAWFPNLSAEYPQLIEGKPVQWLGVTSKSEVAATDPAKQNGSDAIEVLSSEDDLLLDEGDDLLGDLEEDLLEDSLLEGDSLEGDLLEGDLDVEPEGKRQNETSNVRANEDKAAWGGWFRENYDLYYRPSGHEDDFMRFWIERSSAHQSTEEMLGVIKSRFSKETVGKCLKCHQLDKGQILAWSQPGSEPELTHFDHVPHLLVEGDCRSCHPFRKSDENGEARPSSFEPLKRQDCVRCHSQEKRSSNCQLCHDYHRGWVSPPSTADLNWKP